MKRARPSPLLIHLRDRKILRPCCSSAIRYTNYWSEFPEAVKVEILSKLSEEDLFKLKFVCKEWNFLISTICIPMLSPPNPATPMGGILSFENPPPELEWGDADVDPDPNPDADKFLRLEFNPTHRYCVKMRDVIMSLLPSTDCDPSKIIDCCNGLILLKANPEWYFVGNPATRQRVAVPIRVGNHAQSCHSSLAFDPNISIHFKIFRFTRPAVDATPSSPLALEVFSSQCGGGWSSHVLPLKPQSLYGFEWIRRSIYFKGALYFMSMAMYLVCVEPGRGNLSADICLRAWAVELPDKSQITMEQANEGLHGCIGRSLGSFYYSNRDDDGNVLVWMLVGKGENSEWVLKHSISVDRDMLPVSYERMVDGFKIWNSFRPRAFHPTDDAIIMGSSMLTALYHLKTKYFDCIHSPWRHRRETIMCDHNQIFPYARCLMSLNTITSF